MQRHVLIVVLPNHALKGSVAGVMGMVGIAIPHIVILYHLAARPIPGIIAGGQNFYSKENLPANGRTGISVLWRNEMPG
jgi:hypothetical protein